MLVAPVAVSAYVYHADTAGGKIGRVGLNGKRDHYPLVKGAGGPVDLAVDADHIYWADEDSNRIGRANIDGTGVDPDFITAASFPNSVAVDSGHIYWTNRAPANATTDSIGRANLNGTSPDQDWITDLDAPISLAVDSTHVYWGQAGAPSIIPSTIARAGIDGSNPGVIANTAENPTALTLDAAHIYWSSPRAIGRANLNGSSPEDHFLSSGGSLGDVALLSGRLYWADFTGQWISTAGADGSGLNIDLFSTHHNDALALDARADPPKPRLTAHPSQRIKSKRGHVRVRFEFESRSSVALRCKRDKGDFSTCTSPQSYKVAPGSHSFEVYGVNDIGSAGASKTFKFQFKRVRRG